MFEIFFARKVHVGNPQHLSIVTAKCLLSRKFAIFGLLRQSCSSCKRRLNLTDALTFYTGDANFGARLSFRLEGSAFYPTLFNVDAGQYPFDHVEHSREELHL